MCKIREEQLEGCEEDLTNAVKKAYEMRDAILAQDPSFDNERFKKWQRALKSEGEEGCGDVEAADKLCALIGMLNLVRNFTTRGRCLKNQLIWFF